MASAGDVNGDGYDDLIIGAPGADANGSWTGANYVVFGGAFGATVTTTGTAAAEMLIGGTGDDVLTRWRRGRRVPCRRRRRPAGRQRPRVPRWPTAAAAPTRWRSAGAGLMLDLTASADRASSKASSGSTSPGSGNNTLKINAGRRAGRRRRGRGRQARARPSTAMPATGCRSAKRCWTKTGTFTDARHLRSLRARQRPGGVEQGVTGRSARERPPLEPRRQQRLQAERRWRQAIRAAGRSRRRAT